MQSHYLQASFTMASGTQAELWYAGFPAPSNKDLVDARWDSEEFEQYHIQCGLTANGSLHYVNQQNPRSGNNFQCG